MSASCMALRITVEFPPCSRRSRSRAACVLLRPWVPSVPGREDSHDVMAASALRACYRETVRRTRHIGGERGNDLLVEARQFYRSLSVDDAASLEEAVSQARSRLSFLRMVSPRFAAGSSATPAEGGGGGSSVKGGHFVLRDGKLVEAATAPATGRAPISGYNERNLDPEAVRRHQRLVERQYFGGDAWRGRARPKSPFQR